MSYIIAVHYRHAIIKLVVKRHEIRGEKLDCVKLVNNLDLAFAL